MIKTQTFGFLLMAVLLSIAVDMRAADEKIMDKASWDMYPEWQRQEMIREGWKVAPAVAQPAAAVPAAALSRPRSRSVSPVRRPSSPQAPQAFIMAAPAPQGAVAPDLSWGTRYPAIKRYVTAAGVGGGAGAAAAALTKKSVPYGAALGAGGGAALQALYENREELAKRWRLARAMFWEEDNVIRPGDSPAVRKAKRARQTKINEAMLEQEERKEEERNRRIRTKIEEDMRKREQKEQEQARARYEALSNPNIKWE